MRAKTSISRTVACALTALSLLMGSHLADAGADGPAAIARNADGSCAVLPGSHFDLDVSGLPVNPSSA